MSTLSKIIGEIQKIPVGEKTSYKIISTNMGWSTHCGRIIHKEIAPHWAGIIEERREGRKVFMHVIGDTSPLSLLVEEENKAKLEKKAESKLKRKAKAKIKREKKKIDADKVVEDNNKSIEEPVEQSPRGIDDQFEEDDFFGEKEQKKEARVAK